MFGTGIGHFVPIVAYVGFWVMTIMSLAGRPLFGMYYLLPFVPYRTMRDHFGDYPLGENMMTILICAVIVGALIKGKRLPKSKLYLIWAVFGVYLYFSMWLGNMMGNAPAPLWLSDQNFVTWKDYMVIPLLGVAAALVIEDRKAIRNVILLTGISLLFIDRSCILTSLSHTWSNFDENKRGDGPLAFGSNQTAAFLAQFGMLFWGFAVYMKRKKVRIACYALVAATIFAAMYTFSRAGYLAILVSVLILGLLKDRKLLVVLGVFLFTWQALVPTAVRERVQMTETANGQLELSAQERIDLWEGAEKSFLSSPILGMGFATFQYGEHVDNLVDTHNWYVKVLVETGIIGMVFAVMLLQQMLVIPYRIFRHSTDPLYQGLGLGLLLANCACIVANCFGDRWTYLEITGLLWVLMSAAIRARTLAQVDPTATTAPAVVVNPYLAYR